VAHDLNVGRITIRNIPDVPGIAHRIFSALAGRHVNVDMIVQTASRDGRADISFTVTTADAQAAEEVTRAVAREIGGGDVAAAEGVAKISVVGAGMASNPGVASTMFGALAGEGVNIQMISTSEIKISCIIAAADASKAVRAVHRAFNLDSMR
jgi:aspartate kinase